MCWVVCCLLWSMLPIFTIQKAEYQLHGERMSGIRLSKSSVQMPDTVALLLRIRRNNLALTSIFQKKSSLTNGKNSLGDGWWNAPFPGSTIPGVSAKITRFPLPPLSLWSIFPIPILCSCAYEYSFLLRGARGKLLSTYEQRHGALLHAAYLFNSSPPLCPAGPLFLLVEGIGRLRS